MKKLEQDILETMQADLDGHLRGPHSDMVWLGLSDDRLYEQVAKRHGISVKEAASIGRSLSEQLNYG